MNQKESGGCSGILIGVILGVFAGYLAYDLVAEVVDATDPNHEALIAGFAAFITWCICVWVGGNIADGTFAKYFSEKTKQDNLLTRRTEPKASVSKAPSEGDCPSCNNSHIRMWNGKYRCWNCGYVLTKEPQASLPPVIEMDEEELPPILEPKKSLI